MTQETIATLLETMVSNSTSNPKCPICKDDKPKVEINNPFTGKTNHVFAACDCEIEELVPKNHDDKELANKIKE